MDRYFREHKSDQFNFSTLQILKEVHLSEMTCYKIHTLHLQNCIQNRTDFRKAEKITLTYFLKNAMQLYLVNLAQRLFFELE